MALNPWKRSDRFETVRRSDMGRKRLCGVHAPATGTKRAAMSDNSRSPVAESDVPGWTHFVDVVVVGLGAAGTCASLQAVSAGADVLVLERDGAGGGASALSEGLFYLGGGTAVQQACGYQDDPDNTLAFLRASVPGVSENKLQAFCRGAAEHLSWLEVSAVM